MVELLNTPELTKAGKIRRSIAFSIDESLLLFLISIIILLGIGSFDIENLPENFFLKTTAFILISIAIFFCKDVIKGISPGRWIMGIMVRNANDYQMIPSKWKLIARNLTLTIWMVEVIVLMFSKNKQRLGDRLTKTVVLNNPSKAKKIYRLGLVLLLLLSSISLPKMLLAQHFKSSAAYQTAIHTIEADQDIMQITGGIRSYGLFPDGEIHVKNGHGTAGFQIDVEGNDKKIKVFVRLEKEPNGQWKVIKLKPLPVPSLQP